MCSGDCDCSGARICKMSMRRKRKAGEVSENGTDGSNEKTVRREELGMYPVETYEARKTERAM